MNLLTRASLLALAKSIYYTNHESGKFQSSHVQTAWQYNSQLGTDHRSRGSNAHEQCVTRCPVPGLVHSPGRPASVIREIKIHAYAKRQTSDSSWEFLRIENKQMSKTILMYKTGVKLLFFSWRNKQLTTIKGKTWSLDTNSRLLFGVNVNLNLSITWKISIRDPGITIMGSQQNARGLAGSFVI